MNKLKITLNEDGSVYQYMPDFKIMRGSYRNVLINIEVPHSLLIDPVNDTDENKTKTGNNVRVGGIITTATGKHLQTKRYEFQRVKDFVREGTAYRLYQRKIPKEFTMWDTLDEREEAQSGSLLLVINVINWLINDLNAKVEEISASPSFKLDIQPSAFLQEAEEIEDPSNFDLLQSQVQEHDKEIDDLKRDLYGEGDETLGEFLTSRLKAGWKIKLEKENGQIKVSVETIKAKEVPIDSIPDMKSTDVQKALEELSKRTDSQSVDTVHGEDDYLVDNANPRNPVIKHDKSKIDKASIVDNLTTSDNTKVLAASQGVIIKTEIEAVNESVADETDARGKADTALQDKITAEEATRKSENATLKGLIDNLESVKASKTEMAEAIKTAIDAVVNSAPAAFDTLKEISDWIKNDEEGTSALILRIGEIEKKNQEQDLALADEISARETAESAIKESISAETTARQTADETLQGNIDTEKAAREKADETLTNSKLDDVQILGGTNNGTIKVVKKISTESTTDDNIPITGLKSAAYEDKSAFATVEQGRNADIALQKANDALTEIKAVEDVANETNGSIEDILGQIKLKANQNDVTALETKVSAVETKNSSQDIEISNLQTSTQEMQESLASLISFQTLASSQLSGLSSEVTNITEVVIPELESKIGQGGGSGEDEESWTTIYDKNSDDPEINKGEPDGLKEANQTAILGDVDFSQYTYIRLTFEAIGDPYFYTFNLKSFADMRYYTYVVVHHSYDGSNMTVTSIVRTNETDGRVTLGMGRIYRAHFNASSMSYKIVDDLPYCFIKIEVR